MSTAMLCESVNETRSFTAFMACWYKLNPIGRPRWPSHYINSVVLTNGEISPQKEVMLKAKM